MPDCHIVPVGADVLHVEQRAVRHRPDGHALGLGFGADVAGEEQPALPCHGIDCVHRLRVAGPRAALFI